MADPDLNRPAPVAASIRVDLSADKALRLECLRLAIQMEPKESDIVTTASTYARFVLSDDNGE